MWRTVFNPRVTAALVSKPFWIAIHVKNWFGLVGELLPPHWLWASPFFFPFVYKAGTRQRIREKMGAGDYELEISRATVRFVTDTRFLWYFSLLFEIAVGSMLLRAFWSRKRVFFKCTACSYRVRFPKLRSHKFCTFYVQKQRLCTPFTYCSFNSVHFFPFIGKSATWNDHLQSFKR